MSKSTRASRVRATYDFIKTQRRTFSVQVPWCVLGVGFTMDT
jgi:hypothetical protein